MNYDEVFIDAVCRYDSQKIVEFARDHAQKIPMKAILEMPVSGFREGYWRFWAASILLCYRAPYHLGLKSTQEFVPEQLEERKAARERQQAKRRQDKLEALQRPRKWEYAPLEPNLPSSAQFDFSFLGLTPSERLTLTIELKDKDWFPKRIRAFLEALEQRGGSLEFYEYSPTRIDKVLNLQALLALAQNGKIEFNQPTMNCIYVRKIDVQTLPEISLTKQV